MKTNSWHTWTQPAPQLNDCKCWGRWCYVIKIISQPRLVAEWNQNDAKHHLQTGPCCSLLCAFHFCSLPKYSHMNRPSFMMWLWLFFALGSPRKGNSYTNTLTHSHTLYASHPDPVSFTWRSTSVGVGVHHPVIKLSAVPEQSSMRTGRKPGGNARFQHGGRQFKYVRSCPMIPTHWLVRGGMRNVSRTG